MKQSLRFLPILAISCILSIVPLLAHADSSPTISGAVDTTAEATSSAGAFVSFNITATDATGTPITVTCDPASGTLFAMGTTTVSCSATDSANNATSTDFTVVVRDTTPPVITPPADQTFATSTFPAFPDLTPATATDAVDPDPVIAYTPPSFQVGTTTVTWTATDASGNSAATTSLVIVTDDSATSTATTSPSAATSSPVTIELDIETATTTLFDGPLTVSSCSPQASATSTVNGFCALDQSGLSVSWQWYSFGAALVSVNGDGDWDNGPWWTTFSNGQPLSEALDQHLLSAGEKLIVTDGPMPLELSVSTTSPQVGATTTVTVLGFNVNNYDFEPVSGAMIHGIGTTTDANGNVDVTATSTDAFSISASATGFLPGNSLTITPYTPGGSNPVQTSGGGGGGGNIAHSQFNLSNALSYLSGKQNPDGSFGTADSSLITDWMAIAFASANPGAAKTKLFNYLLTATPAMASVTDYERHAMALEAMNINPYSGTPVNYIAPIVEAFDGTQIGDPSLDNDDIFSIIPLMQAGYSPVDPLVQKEVTYIMSRQRPDGSWDESPDMTAAAIQAVGPFFTFPNYPQVMGAAAGYLLSTEQANGSWGTGGVTNIDSTSWVQTAINAIPTDPTHGGMSWASPEGFLPADAIANAQQSDGAVRPVSDPVDSRVWSTSYAVVAASGQSWLSVLQLFPEPAATSGGVGGGGSIAVALATSTATSTPLAASSTPAMATPTPEISGISTPPVLTTAGATTSSTQAHHGSKPVTHPKKNAAGVTGSTSPVPAISPESQVAAAGSAGGGFFTDLWHAVTSFFSSWF